MCDYPHVPFDRAGRAETLRASAPARPLVYQAPDARGAAYGLQTCHAPRTLAALGRVCAEHPQARIVGGGTDVGLWITKQLRDLPEIVLTAEVAELQAIRHDTDALTIGAAASLEDAFAALVGDYPELAELH